MLDQLVSQTQAYIQASPHLAVAAVFVGGALTASNPCALATVPMMASFVAETELVPRPGGPRACREDGSMKLQVFDPPMCCPTGVCGPEVDPDLVRFAADLDWVARRGVTVERFNLGQQPAAFVSTPLVKETLQKEGNDCLPLVLADGAVVAMGAYPDRKALAAVAGLEAEPTIFTDAVAELVAIGAAIGSNCEPCFKYHYNQARKLGVSKADMRLAVEMARRVKETPARAILELAGKILADHELTALQPVSDPAPSGFGVKKSCC